MKKLIEEVDEEGLIALLGKLVTLYCVNYIYTGKLVGVNDEYVKLDSAAVVYETGPYGEGKFKDAQPLKNGGPWYVRTAAIESFGELKLVV